MSEARRITGGARFPLNWTLSTPLAVLIYDSQSVSITARPRMLRSWITKAIADAPSDAKAPVWSRPWDEMRSLQFDPFSIYFRPKQGQAFCFFPRSIPVAAIVTDLEGVGVPLVSVARNPRFF